MSWQPIETAPKDGTWIDAWRPRMRGVWRASRVTVRWDSDQQKWAWPDDDYDAMAYPHEANGSVASGDCYGDDSFTYWMPLPAPPES